MPKNIRIIIGIITVLLLGLLPRLGMAAAEKISSFNSSVKINPDASINVTETIVYDFNGNTRHGIFRNIPVYYQTQSGAYTLEVSNVKVSDQNNRPYRFSASYSGNDLSLKIGDPNVTVTGVKTYVISYNASQAINYFSDHDELYWNVTGNNWDINIDRAAAKVTLPQDINKNEVKVLCFAGEQGSKVPCASAQLNSASLSADFSQSTLGPNQGLTFVIWLPKGAVLENKSQQNKAAQTPRPNPSQPLRSPIPQAYGVWFLVLPVLTLITMLYVWNIRGRDPKGYETVIAQYDPPAGLTPTEVGTIVDERADNQDITADIINLAVKGYIKITRTENKVLFFTSTDYRLDKLKEPGDLENKFEIRLMESLFSGAANSVLLSDLKNKFYRDLGEIKKDVYSSVVNKGYFLKSPDRVRTYYLILGILVCFLGIGALFLTLSALALAALVISGILIIIFSFFMPAKTFKGAEAKQYILGLKRYLSVAEKDRLAFHNAPEKNPARFEKLLPYAMALGVDEAWAKQFAGIYNQPPSWYNDPTGHMFNSMLLASSLRNFSQTANAAFASRPSSGSSGAAGGFSGFGGGGFSGGGFGGGGGGSW